MQEFAEQKRRSAQLSKKISCISSAVKYGIAPLVDQSTALPFNNFRSLFSENYSTGKTMLVV